MADDLTLLETWCAPLLAKLTAGQRTQVARKIGQALRRSQHQRIVANRAPDGIPSVSGAASGFRSVCCNRAPAAPRAAPASRQTTTRGNQTMRHASSGRLKLATG